ncbi:hypothetical protein L1887_04544 [Cichorium endivia]|nr:hypothetical protein L1887_04544 [Cichorium endivia]
MFLPLASELEAFAGILAARDGQQCYNDTSSPFSFLPITHTETPPFFAAGLHVLSLSLHTFLKSSAISRLFHQIPLFTAKPILITPFVIFLTVNSP